MPRPDLYDTEVIYRYRKNGAWSPSLVAQHKLKAFDDENADYRARQRLLNKLKYAGLIADENDLDIKDVTYSFVPDGKSVAGSL